MEYLCILVLYANIDKFDATKYSLEYDKLPVMDKWLLSKMNSMVKAVDDNLMNYWYPWRLQRLFRNRTYE